MAQYNALQEEELKLVIAEQFFADFDCKPRIGKIDFCVIPKHQQQKDSAYFVSLLWGEAKRGIVIDIYKPLVQLILTIGKARTFEAYLPPPFLAAFDAEKIAFIPYKDILPFFALNDFNWTITPSDDTSREFGLLYGAVKDTLEHTSYIFRYDVHETELREFIKQHLSESSELIQINKNNFVSIYQRWLAQVQPTIDVDWNLLKKRGLIDGDFFLADLLSEKNQTIKDALYVLLQDNRYALDRKVDPDGLLNEKYAFFKDRQKAHAQFWSLYQRPPQEEYWDYIIKRRDLLVPQDVRERKGSFFTPKIWVDLSQKYIADVLGENWQDEYYVWDCAAGTGNLLNGLTNKYNIWASTLDQQDVDVMKDRIKNGANLLESHVFQFDFLNDEFTKLPQPLQDIINDPEKRKKLVIYINPPYAELGNKRALTRHELNKRRVANDHATYSRYFPMLKQASRELFAQFIIRIYKEIPNCYLAQFSKLKIVQAPNFSTFRKYFKARLEKSFLVPGSTFDNVKGNFPIGFFIWALSHHECFEKGKSDIYDSDGRLTGVKKLGLSPDFRTINNWCFSACRREGRYHLGFMYATSNDFQHNAMTYTVNSRTQIPNPIGNEIYENNLCETAIYIAVRYCIAPTWLNDRDQFLYPKDGWQRDHEFQNNCLAFTLFHTQNRISALEGINHWIPFTEQEVAAKEKFQSHFMTDFIAGRCPAAGTKYEVLSTTQSEEKKKSKKEMGSLLHLTEEESFVPTEPLEFSPEATAVFDAGRELWRYYHAQPNANPNASYYNIREYFHGRNEKGKMNAKSDDAEYMRLLANLKEAMEVLRQQIVPKVYEYGFLI